MIERESESDRREDVFRYHASYLSKTRAHFVPLKPKLLDMARVNVHPLRLVHELLYVCALSHGIIVHHEDGVDCLVDARGAKGVTAQAFCGPDQRLIPLPLEQPLDRA